MSLDKVTLTSRISHILEVNVYLNVSYIPKMFNTILTSRFTHVLEVNVYLNVCLAKKPNTKSSSS